MYLKRFAFIKLSEIPRDLSLFNQTYNGVTLETGEIGEANRAFNSILVTAKIKLSYLPINEDNQLITPHQERKQCESTIEKISKIFSIGYNIKREIFSSWQRCVTYEPENEAEHNRLIATDISLYENYSIDIIGTPPLFKFDWKLAYSDRTHGVDLMADALNHTNSSGQFRDYIRLFENAFNLPTQQLRKKMVRFLNPKFGYTAAEIDRWLQLRDPLSHADNRKSSQILFESDVTPYIQRVRQAAYDVLLNKKTWSQNSSERRNLWSAGAYTKNMAREAAISAGAENVKYSIIDPYNTYPVIQGIGIVNIAGTHFPGTKANMQRQLESE